MFLFLPVYLSSPDIYWELEEMLFSWMLSIVSCWSWSAGYNIVESGESLTVGRASTDNRADLHNCYFNCKVVSLE